ncbi:MAG TPA: exodeoxyribonuclease III, partial [Acetobacteraceae bacterium]|nr:exodeoxyribonuclease III [Acetobacteraceae bacterium]
MSRPLLVIDGDSFAHRAYHALPKSIRRTGDRGGGAIVGFANFLLRLFQAETPRAVLVAWDTLGAPTYRQRLFPDYQGGRQFDAELIDQLDTLPQFVAACGFANAKAAGYEADDFLAAAVADEERRGGTVLVASGDRDAFQLASDATTILHPLRAGEMARIGPAEVWERYGVEPRQVPDFIALRGDPSDRLPGASGVGPKGAATLLRRYGTLEQALADGRFTEQADALRRYRQIATMDAKAPLPALPDQTPTWDLAAALAHDWGLAQLARRLTELAGSEARPASRPSSRRRAGPSLKIATFNINNVNRRLPNLLAWLRESKPAVACLQELKAADEAFPEAAIRDAGYHALWRGQRTYNGVAILAATEPQPTRDALPGDPGDTQSRYIEAAVQGVLVACIYLPNGNPQPGPKFAYKLAWFERLIAHARTLYALQAPVVLAGDFNVVPTDRDIYPSKSWAKDALLQPESRACFRRLLDQGWVDAVRTRHPDDPMYSFWDYKRDRWPRDAGLRIDFLLLNRVAADRLIDAGVDRTARGEEGASDHAP